jgi:hypothetical protein
MKVSFKKLIKERIKGFMLFKIAVCLPLIPLLLLGASLSCQAQSAGGGYAESYMLRDVGARAISMGGAYTAISNEPMTIFYNPAGLGFMEAVPVINTCNSFLEFNRTHSTIAWSQSFEGLENFGFGFGINNYTSGAFMARNIKGDPIGEMTDWGYALNAAAAYRLEFASLGVAVKYLSNTLQGSGTSANGFAVDIGTKFNIMDLFSVGVCIQNISGMMFWNTKTAPADLIPYTIRTGVAMEFGLNEESYTTRSTVSGEMESYFVPATKYVLLSLDAVLTQYENAPSLQMGIEVVPHEYVAFRGGLSLAGDNLNKYEFFPMNKWGAGVSVRPPFEEYNIDLPFHTNIDYSVSADNMAKSKIAHHISLLFRF